MKQYRITSANFVPQGETGDADAYIDPNELNELKRLAGMPIAEDNGAGLVGGNLDNVPQAQEDGKTSPIGTVPKNLEQERRMLEKEYAVQTGTDLWFIINFSKPHLTGGTLKDKVEKYLSAHPEYRPKLPAGS